MHHKLTTNLIRFQIINDFYSFATPHKGDGSYCVDYATQ